MTSELNEKVLSNTNLMTDQDGLIEFENITSSVDNVFIDNGTTIDMSDTNNILPNQEFCPLSFHNAIDHRNSLQYTFEDCNYQYEEFGGLEKSNSSDSMKKFAIVKNTSKWLNQNSSCHLKSSCEEVKLQADINCNPWQCGICDMSFSERSDLTNHVYTHNCDGLSSKYTKLVKNPLSGMLELKEIVPREKPKIIPKEELKPVIENFLLNKKKKVIINEEQFLNENMKYLELFESNQIMRENCAKKELHNIIDHMNDDNMIRNYQEDDVRIDEFSTDDEQVFIL